MSDTNNKIILEVGLKGKENVAEVQKAYDSYMHTLSETAAQVRQVNAAHTESKKELKLQDELARSVAGSYNALSAQYSLNRIQINQMSADELKNTEAGQKLVSETAAIREEMKKSQESTGNNSLSVGSYTDSIKNAISQTGLFGTELYRKFKA